MEQYITTIILSVVSGLLLWIVKGLLADNRQLREGRRQEEQAREQAIAQGLVSLLRVQLIEYYDHYMAQGSIPTYVYDNYCDMYAAYHALGGNGMVTHMMEDLNTIRMSNDRTPGGETNASRKKE